MNKKGFTLVELLVTIAVSTLVLSLGMILVNEMIEKNENKTEKLAKENIKNSASLYSREFFNEIVWLNNQSCISVEQLISKGYISKDKTEKAQLKYIIIEKDDNNTIISERNSKEDDYDNNLCDAIINQTVASPTNKEICNLQENLVYNGEAKNLTKSQSEIGNIYVLTDPGVKESEAGSYPVEIGLNNGYYWKDGSIDKENNTPSKKTVYCTIQKGIPDLKLKNGNKDDVYGQDGEQTIPIEVTVTSDVPGTIELKSSNNKYVTVEFSQNNEQPNSNELENKEDKYIKNIIIKNNANRKTNTYITIKQNPSDPNYQSTTTTYTIGKITDIKREIPKETFCTNPHFNGDVQTITKEAEVGYTLFNNYQKHVRDDYEITASLHPGFIWEDGTTEDKTFTCAIQPLTYKISYNGNGNTGGSMTSSEHTYGVSKKLTANGFTKTGYTFIGWKDQSGAVTYTNEEAVQDLINPATDENGTVITLYAQWRINKVYIKYSTNEGDIESSTTENGVTSIWTKDANDIIYQATSSQSPTSTFYVYDYGSSTTKAGLADWNNSSYINISKTGYGVKSGEQWICLSGDCAKNKTYDHSKVYAASDFCDASAEDCTAILGVNWVDNVAPSIPTYTAVFDDESGDYTSGSWTNKKVNTIISSSDAGSGVKYIQYSSNKTSWTKLSFSVSTLTKNDTIWSGTEPWNLYDRDKTYYFRSCDNADNCSEPSIAFNIKYDITLPTCTIEYATTAYKVAGVGVTATCDDKGSGCKVTTLANTTITSDQTYTATDNAGNTKTCTADIKTIQRYRSKTKTTYYGGYSTCIWQDSGHTGLNAYHNNILGKTSKTACENACDALKPQSGSAVLIMKNCNAYYSFWSDWSSYNLKSCTSSDTVECSKKTTLYAPNT